MLDRYILLEKDLEKLDLQLQSTTDDTTRAAITSERESLLSGLYQNLNAWETVAIARHPLRPHGLDVITHISDRFELLHGDRASGDCPATICALSRIASKRVMIVAHEKGRTIADRVKHQFGMPEPKGYRKAKRAFELAERLKIPVVTLIDTPGAYPGIQAEEQNQSGAIAENLMLLSQLKVPIINIVIGEGMSGGALGIGIGDRFALLEKAIFSVISPEGCASILWKDAKMAPTAAEKMHITAKQLLKLKLIDDVITEGKYHAFHQDITTTMHAIKTYIVSGLDSLSQLCEEELLKQRHSRLYQYGIE